MNPGRIKYDERGWQGLRLKGLVTSAMQAAKVEKLVQEGLGDQEASIQIKPQYYCATEVLNILFITFKASA